MSRVQAQVLQACVSVVLKAAALTCAWWISQCSTVRFYHGVNNESLALLMACSARHTSQQAAASSCNAQCVDGRFTDPSRRHQTYPARLFWRSRSVSAPPQSFLCSWITKEELQRFPAPPTRRGNEGRVTSRRALVRRARASPSGIQPTFRNFTVLLAWVCRVGQQRCILLCFKSTFQVSVLYQKCFSLCKLLLHNISKLNITFSHLADAFIQMRTMQATKINKRVKICKCCNKSRLTCNIHWNKNDSLNLACNFF